MNESLTEEDKGRLGQPETSIEKDSVNSDLRIQTLGQAAIDAKRMVEEDIDGQLLPTDVAPVSEFQIPGRETSDVENSSEKLSKEKRMRYGSERFENITANNHNEIFFGDLTDVHKLVMGKDVVLVLPSDPNKLNIKSGYPTHQESWLPMWYVLLNHSQAQTPEELEYQRNIAGRVKETDYQLVDKAVTYKAKEFFNEYKTDHTHDDNPRKKYKKLTRILQDSLLYIDREPGVIEDQQEFLEKSPLFPLVQTANALRKGEQLEKAPELEEQIESLLNDLTDKFGGEAEIERSYNTLREEIDANQGDQRVILLPDKTLEDAEFYAKITSCDLLMARDDHDEDIISVVPGMEKGAFYQVNEKFGPKLSKERRTDIIAVPETLEVWETVGGGKESYQPVSMIIVTHSIPESEAGKRLQERLQNEMSPDVVAHHYLGVSEEFLNVSAWGKSFVERINREDLPQVKKVIPLYRVATDLMPRAIYMLKTKEFPSGVSNEELWETGECTSLVKAVQDILERQDASQDELKDLYRRVSEKFAEWYDPSDYQTFLDNMAIMSEKAKQQDQK